MNLKTLGLNLIHCEDARGGGKAGEKVRRGREGYRRGEVGKGFLKFCKRLFYYSFGFPVNYPSPLNLTLSRKTFFLSRNVAHSLNIVMKKNTAFEPIFT